MSEPSEPLPPLYNDYNAMTPAAIEICNAIEDALRPILDRFIETGRNPRDLDYLIGATAGVMCSERVIGAAIEKAFQRGDDP